MIEIVASNPQALSEVRETFDDDLDVVLGAIAQDGNAFQYAGNRLKMTSRLRRKLSVFVASQLFTPGMDFEVTNRFF